MATFLCAVKLIDTNGVGWYGTVEADSPGQAAQVARRKHAPGASAHAPGDRISHVEVHDPDGNKLGDY